jgi:hypothetical protein
MFEICEKILKFEKVWKKVNKKFENMNTDLKLRIVIEIFYI